MYGGNSYDVYSLLHLSLDSRVSVVDYRGQVIVDTYVRPTAKVVDYRGAVTGIEAHHLTSGENERTPAEPRTYRLTIPLSTANAKPFDEVQQDVANLLHGKVIIGYALWNDLSGEETVVFVVNLRELTYDLR